MRTPQRVNLNRLLWVAIVAPVVFVAILEYAVSSFYPELLSWPGRFVMAVIIVVALIAFYGAVFSVIRDMQARLERQNEELLALHRASLGIHGETALDVILERAVDQARQLLSARYGAISVVDESGAIEEFVVSGIGAEEREALGSPPVGRGLLGVVLREREHLRISDISADTRSGGTPPGHPPMKSLLAVPVLCSSPFLGNLYLADKKNAEEFSAEDEETLVRLAAQAAAAIDTAYLHRRLKNLAVAEERARLAREMHDGVAQVLGYVNTKAQAVREFLSRGRTDRATEQLEQLAQAARGVYSDVREGILALRSMPDKDQTFCEALRGYVARWQEHSGVTVDLVIETEVELADEPELQLFRVIQEAMANVRKHAKVDRVRLELRSDGGEVVAIVADAGSGFDQELLDRRGRPRFGMAIMRERAESVGGRLQVTSELGSGTRVEVAVPAGRRG